ncbi:hypothetical protein N7448_010616 [Penicillium atrosanguineum]|nr:hypothetical protein N7448_010616 [Penicillium atrosanguineum]
MNIRAETPPRVHINLQRGWPSTRLLPTQALLAAADATLQNTTRASESMLYGPGLGDPALRNGMTKWLSQLYRLRSPPVTQCPPTNAKGGVQEYHAESISSERICITNGASGNLASVMAAFTDPVYTRRVWMVEPTYFLACTIFEDAGFQDRLVGVPEDEQGLDVELLRAQIEVVDQQEYANTSPSKQTENLKGPPQYEKLYRHVIYLVPTFSNPSAKTYTIKRREALIRLARETDALVVTDDCYDFLSWTVNSEARGNGEICSVKPHDQDPECSSLPPPPPPRMVDIDASLPGGDLEWGNAVSNGSFSKVIGPGMRCGWAEATPAFIKRLNKTGPTLSGGAPGQFSSVLIEHVLSTGALEYHIQNILAPTYRDRSVALQNAIEELLVPLGVEIDIGRPFKYSSCQAESKSPEKLSGGFFLYITFPEGVSADIVAAVALKEYNLRFLSAGAMWVRGSMLKYDKKLLERGARLCWAWEEAEVLVEGVGRIRDVLVDHLLRGNGVSQF